MKRIFLFFTLALTSFMLPELASATHIMGHNFQFTCINSCTTRVEFVVYRDCIGSSSLPANFAWAPLQTPCATPVAASAVSAQLVTEVTPVCPGTNTTCLTGTVPGVQEYYFFQDFDMCAAGGCQFNVTWSLCCRNGAITSGASNQSSFNGATMYDNSQSTCNNSPVFTSIPIFYICAGQNTIGHQGAYDPDGDSLSYSLQSCLVSAGTPVNYNPGYSATAPLGPTWNVSLDPQSGELSFLANPGGLEVGVLCIEVDEYRNGQLIGTLWRDVQVRVMSCGTNVNPQLDMLTNNTAGTLFGDTIFIPAAGNNFCFDMQFSDPDLNQNLTVYWDENIPGATFSDASNATIQDTITGTAPVARFCWTPAQNGVYNFLATVEDDDCPFPGWQDRLITVIVGNYGVFATAIPQGCLQYQLTAVASGGTPPYTYSWTGTGGISTNPNNNQAAFPHTFASTGTYTYSVTVTDQGTFNQTTTGTIVVPTVPPITLIGQSGAVDQCRASTLYLEAPAGYVSYLWSNWDTTRSISTTLPGNYSVVVTDSQGCTFSDTIVALLDTTTTAVLGLAFTHDTLPLVNTKIYMVFYNPVDSSLIAGDSTYTDSSGVYSFGCVPIADDVYLKAAPDSAAYPNNMPTYHFSSLTWQGADNYQYASQNWPVNILCQYGNNPGGPGFIGGLISQGANKRTDPVVDLELWLVNPQGQAIAHTTTNADGYFRFPNLGYDNYTIWVDKPHVDNAVGPEVMINAGLPVQDSLPLVLHTTWLEWMQATGLSNDATNFHSFEVHPNPFKDAFELEFTLESAADIRVELMDMQGRSMVEVDLGMMPGGAHSLEHPGAKGLTPGIYFLKVQAGDQTFVRKLLKL